MAVASIRNRCWADAICHICVKYFTEPVTLDCSHNFCQACITRCWEQLVMQIDCPLCGDSDGLPRGLSRTVTPNRRLAKFVEVVKEEVERTKQARREQQLCETHQKLPRYFCQEDQALLCTTCVISEGHKGHNVTHVKTYQDQIEGYVDILRDMRTEIITFTWSGGIRSKDLQRQVEVERKKMVAEFKRLHAILEEQESARLAQLVALEKEIIRRTDEHTEKISDQIDVLDDIVSEMEENYWEEDSEFLETFGGSLRRFEENKFESPPIFPPELKEKVRKFGDQKLFLEGIGKEFNDEIALILKRRGRKRPQNDVCVEERGTKANVVLNPRTAYPLLILSKDMKSVEASERCLYLSCDPERYNLQNIVLGREGFTSGRHWWEVGVEGNGRGWAVGIIKGSVKYCNQICTEFGVCAVGRSSFGPVSPRRLFAFTSPKETLLILSHKPEKIRVCLDCTEGKVAFFNADTGESIFVFHSAFASGERIYPLFSVWGSVRLTC